MKSSVWQSLASLFRNKRPPRAPIIRIEKAVAIKMTDEEGRQHEYHSLEEAPPEVRAEVERLKSGPWKETARWSSSDGRTTRMGNTREATSKRTVSTYKVRDGAGNERIYHSLDEMPPELRAALEEAQGRNLAGGDGRSAR